MPFQKGNQEAKKARPQKQFADMLRIAVADAADDPKGTPKLRLLADKLVQEALSGNVQALKEVADRLDGKPAQQINHADNEGGPFTVAIVRYADTPTE